MFSDSVVRFSDKDCWFFWGEGGVFILGFTGEDTVGMAGR